MPDKIQVQRKNAVVTQNFKILDHCPGTALPIYSGVGSVFTGNCLCFILAVYINHYQSDFYVVVLNAHRIASD